MIMSHDRHAEAIEEAKREIDVLKERLCEAQAAVSKESDATDAVSERHFVCT